MEPDMTRHDILSPRKTIVSSLFVAFLFASSTTLAKEETPQTLQVLVDEATQVVKDFTNAPKMDTFRELMKSAKGVFISPKVTTLGFVVAGSAGRGVASLRDASSGAWSEPAFYRYKEGSVGLQAGGSQAALMLLMMTDKGVAAVLEEEFKMGAGIGVAAGPVGAGTSQTIKDNPDIVSYSMSEGLFAGVALSGGQIDYRKGWNSDYYGERVSGPAAILVDGAVSSDGTAALREALGQLGM
jgi:lipid-binding SYLF domain-containing protein